jgi:hypothetical protein
VLNLAGITSSILKTDGSNNVVAAINGVDYIGTLFRNWTMSSGALTPTTTIGIIVNASSTIDRLTVNNGTTTNATSTNLHVSGETKLATSFTGLLKAASGVVSTAIAGVDFINNSFRDWQVSGGSLTPTTTIGITVQASSTIRGLTMDLSTTTQATTTIGYIINDLKLGATGILASATDGVLTLLGIGNGNDENLTIDFDNASANTVTIASGTGVATTTFSGMSLSIVSASTTATSSLHGLYIPGKPCNGFTSGGALTVNSTGEVICSNDDSGGGSFSGAAHAIVVSVDGSTLSSSSTPNMVAFNATNTDATSTVRGMFAVGTSTPAGDSLFTIGTSSPLMHIDKSSGKIGFGCENGTPTRFSFGCGTNNNVNTNIMGLFQDSADARFGVSVGDDFIGLKSAGGRVGIFGFDYAAGSALDIVMQEFGGKVGIGTTTPWATLSVMPQTYSASVPLFTIATSTNASSTVFHINATSTTLIPQQPALALKRATTEVGSRVLVGMLESKTGSLDQVTVMGRINTEGWLSFGCDNPGVFAAVTADGVTCGVLFYGEDGAGGSLTNANTYGQNYANVADNTAAGGAGVFAQVGGGILAGTSTPIFSAKVRINGVQNSSTTQFYVGFTDVAPTGASFDTTPTAGCYFTASSTQANWQAVSRTSAAAITQVNTGVSSSTVFTGAGEFREFRVEADSNGCYFYIKSVGEDMFTKVATITTNLSASLTNQGWNAGVYYGRINGAATIGFDFYKFRVWVRDIWPI